MLKLSVLKFFYGIRVPQNAYVCMYFNPLHSHKVYSDGTDGSSMMRVSWPHPHIAVKRIGGGR